ncbi:imidazole glycerol phosphate synthase subunit HisH [Thalassotalea sp. 42_200_T64]|nr:imidazole glycerol phosphate synthase subunit HisH [Thalassotalea sp. 42_200_T64]
MSDTTSADALIIDTGCANISSLKFALQRQGYQIDVSKDIAAIKLAKKVFLPGVGSAEYAMAGINERGLFATITELTQPVLGICLGMQLLTKHSVENNIDTPCLGVIDSSIAKIDTRTDDNLRLPHMGWNTLTEIADSPLFSGIGSDDYFYFVHTYCAPASQQTLASCDYGQKFSASLQQGNFYGVQFHPERSGKTGAKLLKNFMELC